MPQIQEDDDVLIEEITEKDTGTGDIYQIILYNDDVNSFEHVIESLMDICEHSPEQAEQCAMIVHFTGKCGVKTGSWDILRPKAEALIDRGLSATIE